MLAFPRNQGLRIDHVFLSEPLAKRCTAASIDRNERKGKQPSDHAPVLVELDLQ
jgi:exodeoxyribonuclease-3